MSKEEHVPFGEMIRSLRDSKGLSQQELGELVGYGASGAGISILRIEKQSVVPRPKRIDSLAEVLGADPKILRDAAERARSMDAVDPFATRLQSLRGEYARREDLEKKIQKLSQTKESADGLFLLPFRQASEAIGGLPMEAEVALARANGSGAGEISEAKYRLSLTKVGLTRALSAPSNKGSGIEGLASAVAEGAAAAALPAAVGSTAILSSLSAVLRAGQPMARSLGGLSGFVGLTAAMGIGAVVGTFAGRSKRQREELLPILKEAEAEIEDAALNIEALEELIPNATKLYEDIATYAGRALSRWLAQIDTSATHWSDLTTLQQDSFVSLIDVAAAHLAVATISFQDLSLLRGEDLSMARQTAEQMLEEANEVVAARV